MENNDDDDDESHLLDFLTAGRSCEEGVADLLPVDVTEVLEADLRLELEAAFGIDGSSSSSARMIERIVG